jgi:hypothetical protein
VITNGSKYQDLLVSSVGLHFRGDNYENRPLQFDPRHRGVLLTQAPLALAATTWYANGVNGSDSDNCKLPLTACKTIGHAISLAASGDTVRAAAGTYAEHLTIGISLELIGAAASSTVIDGSRTDRVITIPNAGSVVTLANVTIRNGVPPYGYNVFGGGIVNHGTLTINSSTVSGNEAHGEEYGYGGGIWNNFGMLTINNSTLSGNDAACTHQPCYAHGGGINNNGGTVAINNSTIAGNTVRCDCSIGHGGGIYNSGILTISNSTVSGNLAFSGGGIYGGAHLQNSIIANNRSYGPGDCHGTVTSAFSLSSDNSCNLNGPGDLNNVNPRLGTLGNYLGPTQTIPLLSGSPAIDAGNPSGCTDYHGHLLKTDQRGLPRPNSEDRSGCDIGAFERQAD